MKHVKIAGLIFAFTLIAGTALATGMMVPTDEKLPPLAIKHLRVGVGIADGVATTKVEQVFINSTNRRLEANFVFPLPKDAAIKELAMYINGVRTKAELLDAPKARRIYEDIVRRSRDPALLEYMGGKLFRLRVFPIEPKSEQQIEIEYSQALDYDSGLFKFVYPLKVGERFSTTMDDFALSARITSKIPITSVYSPSHTIGIDRVGDREATVGFEQEQAALNKDFVLYYAISDEGFGLNVLPHHPANDDGYFMLLISPKQVVDASELVKKDVVFVFDTSGSMAGEKIEQARRALTFCVNSLNEGDAFNIVQFATTANAYKSELVRVGDDSIKAAREFIAGLDATGGTDINDALLTALAMKPKEGSRPFMIVFLTDGKPTIGETHDEAILKNVAAANSDAVRIFVFGVDHNVNTHLLDRLSQENRGVSEYVEPAENIEVKISNFFGKASHPVLANVKLAFGDGVRAYDTYPRQMPDLFKGVPLQIFGRYSGSGDVAVTLSGDVNGQPRSFTYETAFPEKLEDNEFIARLWATRRVGYLLDEIRLHGENVELVESVKKLAKDYGIVTPYTSYLIVEDQAVIRTANGRGTANGRRAENRTLEETTATDDLDGARARGDDVEEEEVDARFAYDSVARIIGRERAREKAGEEGPASGSGHGGDADVADEASFGDASLETALADSDVGTKLDTFARSISEKQEGREAVWYAKELSKLKDAGKLSEAKPGVVRNVGKRNFFQVGGYWVDGTARADMPVLKIQYASEAYFSLVEWRPELKRFLAIGERLMLVVDGGLIIIGTEGEETLTKEAFEAFFSPPADEETPPAE